MSFSSYGCALDKYAKKKNLYISTSLQNHALKGGCSENCYHIEVIWSGKKIIDKVTNKNLNDDSLLKLIKREINLIELGI